ncbi:MAG: hypothetical protein WC483_00400 [Candidatus Paceibacterota bacterium]
MRCGDDAVASSSLSRRMTSSPPMPRCRCLFSLLVAAIRGPSSAYPEI